MKMLPVGIQSFKDLRENDYLYVDKTADIYRLISSGKPYFLSRPRRFGKSLLVSTLEEVFKGNQGLFEGLYIHDRYDWTRRHPVIRLDFGGMAYHTVAALTNALSDFVNATASRGGVILEKTELPDRFAELIARLHETSGQQVVVLVDEYDKPIIDHLSRLEIAHANREVLRNFYQVLKAVDEHLRFVFLTGVSKFSRASIFSGLNNLNDITLDEDYSTICGYTQQELESCFAEYLDSMTGAGKGSREELLATLRHWYDGYSWDGTRKVYNPFSTLLFFSKRSVRDYWFASGTPTFLVDLLRERNDVRAVVEPVQVQMSAIDSFDIHALDTTMLLFQTGYL
ncbi:MAG: AAA family ATPase, partial [Odoribacteraceae bacterium]|nr:AAA family ATPase [Odoribacteraceae bacterium]